jgi:4-alpha-glucanotransferase
VLLHPTSLPGGRLGEEAYRFVDWLAEAGQSWWEVLPLGPPDEHGSPYRARSAFAGSTALLAEPRAPVSADEVDDFVARHAYWSAEWAAYERRGALEGQVRFEREWSALRRYASARGVRIFGDLPIYVSDAGADLASHPGALRHPACRRSTAGCLQRHRPALGQSHVPLASGAGGGVPLVDRALPRTFELVDLTRLDHFRGFVSYWAVPAGAKTAKAGRWRRGPGIELFEAAQRELGELPLVAEDLGSVTPAVYRLRDRLGLPGMVVLQFGFTRRRSSPHRLENHPEHAVVYTGTHDHDTALGWWSSLSPRTRQGDRPRPGRPRVVADRARALLARAARDRPRPGRARPR